MRYSYMFIILSSLSISVCASDNYYNFNSAPIWPRQLAGAISFSLAIGAGMAAVETVAYDAYARITSPEERTPEMCIQVNKKPSLILKRAAVCAAITGITGYIGYTLTEGGKFLYRIK